MSKFYITTAIDYVNAPPHVGHAMEKILADAIARYKRTLNKEVFFLMGVDENSLKNVRAAEKEKITTQALVDKYAQSFSGLKSVLNLSFDDFIRTTEKRHFIGAKKLWLACQKDVYKKSYQGLYCVDCEQFCKERELVDGLCPDHKTKPELIKEENYFFQLSKYQEQLKKIIEDDEIRIIPETRKNEILSFINKGLEDICISRSSERARGWGIDVPNDPSQKIWVWFDALGNYINALGYGENSDKFQDWWQNNKNKLHVVGKDILRFHAVYWPAMLLSAGLSLPREIFAHGFITVDGQKMSKSLGNIVDPYELVEKYGADAVRYFLLAEFPMTGDGDFTYEKLEKKYNADLASGIGNLFERILTMAKDYSYNIKTNKKEIDSDIASFFEKIKINYSQKMDNCQIYETILEIFTFTKKLDQYINQKEPWRMFKNKNDELNKVLATLIFGLENIIVWLKPIMPSKMEQAEEHLKTFSSNSKKLNLFPRIS